MTRSTRHRTARDRRRSADRVLARPRLEGLEDRCLLTPTITEYTTPTGAGPYGITAGPDGNLWFTEAATQIGMINPATHVITEYTIPTANATARAITTGPDGNLWFTENSPVGKTLNAVAKIGMINPSSHF